MAATPAGIKVVASVMCLVILAAFIVVLFYFFIFDTPTYVTVTLLSARGLDAADEQTTRTTNAVEFDVAIGFLHLGKDSAVAHDGGHVTISYSGVKLAEGPVPKFFVAGGPRQVVVEATRAVATAAPLSQTFRDYLQVSQQLHGGKAEFEVHLSFFDKHDIVTGDTKRSHYHCTAGLAIQGKAAAATICGEAASLPRSYYS